MCIFVFKLGTIAPTVTNNLTNLTCAIISLGLLQYVNTCKMLLPLCAVVEDIQYVARRHFVFSFESFED